MPYVTFSRNAKARKPALLDSCSKINSLFKRSVVVMRGNKSIKTVASDAASRGFGKVVVVQGRHADDVSVLNVTKLGGGYEWKGKFVLKVDGSEITVERDGNDAKKTFVSAARD